MIRSLNTGFLTLSFLTIGLIGTHEVQAELGSSDKKNSGGICWFYGRDPKTNKCRDKAEWCALSANTKRDQCKGVKTTQTAPTKKPSSSKAATSNKSSGGKGVFPVAKCYGLKNGGGRGAYGTPRRNGSRSYTHTGIDWYAPRGTALLSPWPGKVTQSSSSSRAGNTIRITHDNGQKTVYMHLNSRSVSVGARVGAGDKIGTVGNTGNASRQAPHVHFELLNSKGQRVNPGNIFGCTHNSGK